MRRHLIAGFLGAMIFSGAAAAEETPRTSLDDLAWLEGCWKGEGFGAVVEECWMRAPDGRLTGMFQMLDGEAQRFSEIFTLADFDGRIELRLKHFNPDMTSWEEKDAFVTFPLVESGEGYGRFEGVTYRRTPDGRLVVDLDVKRAGGMETERLTFVRTR